MEGCCSTGQSPLQAVEPMEEEEEEEEKEEDEKEEEEKKKEEEKKEKKYVCQFCNQAGLLVSPKNCHSTPVVL